ncbi:MAG TPA: sigma-54 dependent transcriptional regulator [Thermoanaerobaculia bacterium]|nr:sigma-54 dependent transcriptional regulator [Thermoanaerobaculia bacterium]
MSAARKRRNPVLTDFVRTKSPAMRAVVQTVEKVIDHDVNVFLLGESGVGKDHLAEAIHACGPRRDRPLVRIDCAAIPAELFEAELFGFEKGTFTDAVARKVGKLEMVQGGTVYFDDVVSLAPHLQAKLLRAIQEKRFTRLGGHQSISFDSRILSSSMGGTLRNDLLYRLNVVTIEIPPLRERPEDIEPLAKAFVARRKRGIDKTAVEMLRAHRWPGNVRELRNVIDRAVLLEESDWVTSRSLPPLESDFVGAAAEREWTLEQLEARYIREVLRRTRSNFSRAAAILGINRKTLLEKRRKYEID